MFTAVSHRSRLNAGMLSYLAFHYAQQVRLQNEISALMRPLLLLSLINWSHSPLSTWLRTVYKALSANRLLKCLRLQLC